MNNGSKQPADKTGAAGDKREVPREVKVPMVNGEDEMVPTYAETMKQLNEIKGDYEEKGKTDLLVKVDGGVLIDISKIGKQVAYLSTTVDKMNRMKEKAAASSIKITMKAASKAPFTWPAYYPYGYYPGKENAFKSLHDVLNEMRGCKTNWDVVKSDKRYAGPSCCSLADKTKNRVATIQCLNFSNRILATEVQELTFRAEKLEKKTTSMQKQLSGVKWNFYYLLGFICFGFAMLYHWWRLQVETMFAGNDVTTTTAVVTTAVVTTPQPSLTS